MWFLYFPANSFAYKLLYIKIAGKTKKITTPNLGKGKGDVVPVKRVKRVVKHSPLYSLSLSKREYRVFTGTAELITRAFKNYINARF